MKGRFYESRGDMRAYGPDCPPWYELESGVEDYVGLEWAATTSGFPRRKTVHHSAPSEPEAHWLVGFEGDRPALVLHWRLDVWCDAVWEDRTEEELPGLLERWAL